MRASSNRSEVAEHLVRQGITSISVDADAVPDHLAAVTFHPRQATGDALREQVLDDVAYPQLVIRVGRAPVSGPPRLAATLADVLSAHPPR